MDGFDRALAEFSGYPDVIRLEEQHFVEHGLAVPTRFRDLSKDFRFYWVRFATILKPAPGTVFNKLQCAVQFNPSSAGHLLPRAAMILPDRKFQTMLGGDLGLDVHIGANFEFEAATPPATKTVAGAGGAASADVKAAAKLGIVAGPFSYKIKRAIVDHTAPGAEKVYWTLSGSEFVETDDLSLVVVLQVPAAVTEVEIAAALRAYHRVNLADDFGPTLSYLRRRVTEFFKAGAPTAAPPTVWNITPNL
jgi:hypothetical protein